MLVLRSLRLGGPRQSSTFHSPGSSIPVALRANLPDELRMQNRTFSLLAATIAALTTAAGAAQAEVPCWPAIDVVTSTLPELVAKEARHTWRGLPVEFECRGREVGSITVRWGAAAGTLSDARSAVAALGSHLTADTSTAVRGGRRSLHPGGR